MPQPIRRALLSVSDKSGIVELARSLADRDVELLSTGGTAKMIDEAGIDCRLEIDGGVKVDNIKEVCEAGVDMFVAGSAILKEPRTVEAYKETIDAMRAELAAAEK